MHILPVQVYYEDTDHSGRVYHANYLKYFERAREHMLGPRELVRLWEQEGIGFVVYHVEMTFKDGAIFGDVMEVRSTARLHSAYRAIFDQQIWRPGATQAAVLGEVHLACINRESKLIPIPEGIQRLLKEGAQV